MLLLYDALSEPRTSGRAVAARGAPGWAGGRADPSPVPAAGSGAEQKRRADAALCWLPHRHTARLENGLWQTDDVVETKVNT